MAIVTALLTTPEGRLALDRAVAEARERGMPLHLVAFVANPDRGGSSESYARERATRAAELDRQVARIEASGVTCTGHAPVGVSRLATAINEVAAEVNADQIVIGLRRRSRVGKLLLGSDAQEILLHADCAVLAVKASGDDQF